MNTPIKGIKRASVLGHQLNAHVEQKHMYQVQLLLRSESGAFGEWSDMGLPHFYWTDADEAREHAVETFDNVKASRVVHLAQISITNIVNEVDHES